MEEQRGGMAEITELLQSARQGEKASLEAVFDRLYPELKQVAAARLRSLPAGATVSPTVLVHEVYMRLVGSRRLELKDRHHFFACAARAMRQILVDHARRASADKRGGDLDRVTLDEGSGSDAPLALEILDLDRALASLERVNPRGRAVVDLRFFAGLTAPEAAELLGLSLRTANREWRRARAFLYAQLQEGSA